jgi:hypothetical protein
MADLKKYRIPSDPVGLAYYRQGTQYHPGSIVHLPADELPPGWVRDEKAPGGMKPRARHAWKLIEPGKKETSDEKLTKLEEARKAKVELAKQLEEQERLLEELEAEGGEAGEGEEEEPDDDQPEAEPKGPGVEDVDAEGKPSETKKAKGAKGKPGRKAKATPDPDEKPERSKDPEL